MLPLLALTACKWLHEDRPPDVVIVLVDTLRADGPSYAGNPHPTTPNLDALVSGEATWFSHASAGSCWTLPSTTTLLTGLYPWQHRVIRTMRDMELYGRLDPAVPTLGSAFHDRGYRTAAFVNNAFLAPEFGLNRHFDLYNYEGADSNSHRSAAATVREALEWLDASTTSSLLIVHMMEPHSEYVAPPPFQGQFTAGLPHTLPSPPFGPERLRSWMARKEEPSLEDQAFVRAAYDEEILAVDEAIGQLIAGLRERERWENTVFVVTADHGEEFWDNGGYEHGHSTRSVLTHVPLVIKAPGYLPGRNDTIVDHTDLYQALVNNSGVIPEVARSGEFRRGEFAFAEDLLYGPQEVTAANEDLRLIIHLATKDAELWVLNDRWQEVEALHTQPDRREAARVPLEALMRVRGNLEPTEPNNPTEIQSADTFDMLRKLGYIE